MNVFSKEELAGFEKRTPIIFKASDSTKLKDLKTLMEDSSTNVIDRIDHQIRELVKIENIGSDFSDEQLASEVEKRLGQDSIQYGCWVYFPWNKALIHLLDEPDFIRVRTDRNRDKISSSEQNSLKNKRIGIIGMSVGRAVATTIALERIAGSIRIADFDTLDLSNLNRLKAPLRDLGLKKTVSVAREIMEIDPFLHLECTDDGFTDSNGEQFLLDGGKLDVLVDECDSLEVKVACRLMARKHGIPVVMETSDRGMLDVERFDLEPDRPIFHGKLQDVDLDQRPLSPELRGEVLMKIVDFQNLSEKAQLSLPQVGKTLSTWPQLASSVVLGGGTVTNTVRKILLGEEVKSGRYYVDVDQIIA